MRALPYIFVGSKQVSETPNGCEQFTINSTHSESSRSGIQRDCLCPTLLQVMMAEAVYSDDSETTGNKAFERFCSTTSGVTFTSTDEEYDLLSLPEVDEDFLDDHDLHDDSSREGSKLFGCPNFG